VTNEGFDGRPVDESLVRRAPCEEPAAQTASARVDSGNDPSFVPEAELDVMGDDKTARLDADEPAPEHVITEEHLTLAALEVREVEVFARKLHCAGAHLGYPIARDEELSPGDASDKPGDGRVATLGKACDDIVDTAEAPTCSIHERAAHDPGQCEPARRGGRLPGV
jgi:hypothetical protein